MATITGHVFFPTALPPGDTPYGIIIHVLGSGGEWTGRTDSIGFYAIPDIVPGYVQINAVTGLCDCKAYTANTFLGPGVNHWDIQFERR